jgi:hypothetical protein
MYIQKVNDIRIGKNIMKNIIKNKYLSVFNTDENGDFKDDRIVFVVFGFAILGLGLAEAIAEMML